MANLNTLIVNGPSRFVGHVYVGNITVSSNATFNELTASSITSTGNLSVTGTSSLGVMSVSGTATFAKTTAASGTANNSPALIVGGTYSQAHLEMDSNKLMAKGGASTTADLWLNKDGGEVKLSTSGKVSANNGVLTSETIHSDLLFNSGQITSNDINVTNLLRATKYDLQTISQTGGSLYISPTIIFPNSGSQLNITKTSTTITFKVTDSSITSTTLSGIVWAANSRVKMSGNINGITTGTLDGTVTEINTSSHFITISVTGSGSNDVNFTNIIDDIPEGNFTASQFSDLQIAIYQRRDSGNDYRVGIWLSCYDIVNNSFAIRMYSGSGTQPQVMLGNLTNAGLGTVNGMTPTGYGLYAENVFLHGVISATSGSIGGFELSNSAIKTANVAVTDNTDNSVSLSSVNFTRTVAGASRTNLRFALGSHFGVSNAGDLYANQGVIGGWTIGTSSLYNTTNSMTSTGVGLYLGTDGIRNYKDTNNYVNIKDGVITAKGVDLSGSITATSGTIGGCSISDGVLQVASANITALDATKISSGTISADRIAANSIDMSKLTVDTLYVGQRNLIVSPSPLDANEWYLLRVSINDNVLTLTPTTSASYAKYKSTYLTYKYYKDHSYTVSFYARRISGDSSYSAGNIVCYLAIVPADRLDTTISSTADKYLGETVSVTTEWAKYSLSFYVPDGLIGGVDTAIADDSYIAFELYLAKNFLPIEVKEIEFHKGSIDDVYTSGKTTIDGGKITTNSITATQIDASTLTIGQSQVTNLTSDLADAATTATNYITADSSGISIHNSGNANDYLDISSTGTSIYKGGSQMANFGTDILLGLTSGTNRNVFIDSDSGVSIRKGTTVLANYGDTITLYHGTSGKKALTIDSTNGVQFYELDGSTKAAQLNASGLTVSEGVIGGFQIDSTSIRTSGVAVTSNASNSVSLSSADFKRTIAGSERSGLRFAIADSYGVANDGTVYSAKGLLGPWSFTTTYLRNGDIAGATNTSVAGVYLGTDGLNISGGTAAKTAYIQKNGSNINVNIGNKLTWNGTTLSVSGSIEATSGTIGGCSITNGVLEIANANITSLDASKISSGTISADRIATNSITTSKLVLSDPTNYITVNESNSASAITDNHPFGTNGSAVANGYITKITATDQYIAFAGYTPNSFLEGDELYYSLSVKGATDGTGVIRIWFYGLDGTTDSKSNTVSISGSSISFTTTDTVYTGTIKVTAAAASRGYYAIGFLDQRSSDARDQVYIKNASIRKKSGANLIVDGAITAEKIAIGAAYPKSKNLIINTLYPSVASTSDYPKIFGQTSDTVCSTGTKTTAMHGIRVTNTGEVRTYIRFGAASGTTTSMNGLVPGKTYTLSFDASWKVLSSEIGMAVTGTNYMRASLYDDTATEGTLALDVYKNFASVTQALKGTEMSGRCEFTFTIPSNVTMLYLHIANTQTAKNNYAAEDYIEIRNVMLVEGDQAVDWTPASQDTLTSAVISAAGGLFTVSNNGELTAKGATITGELNADTGTFGGSSGFKIASNCMYCNDKASIDNTNSGVYIGTNGISLGQNSVFKVTSAGAITATSGAIGGFTIDANSIRSGTLTSTSNGAVALTNTDFTRLIGGVSSSGLRLAIGSQFCVSKTGFMRASNAELLGTTKARWIQAKDSYYIYGIKTENNQEVERDAKKIITAWWDAIQLTDNDYPNISFGARPDPLVTDSYLIHNGICCRYIPASGNSYTNMVDIAAKNVTFYQPDSSNNDEKSTTVKIIGDLTVSNEADSSYGNVTVQGTLEAASITTTGNIRGSLNAIRASTNYGIYVTSTAYNTSSGTYPSINPATFSGNTPTNTNGRICLGASNARYLQIWCTQSSLNSTSDRNLKENIVRFDSRFEKAYMDLIPTTYTWKNFTEEDHHDRKHWGFIAQDVEAVLNQNGISNKETGFLCKDELDVPNAAGKTTEYSLRYGEMIALNTHMTQKAHRRIDELEKEIEKLQEQLAMLKSEVR